MRLCERFAVGAVAVLFISLFCINKVRATVTIATVPIGNPNNKADPGVSGSGAVDYNYSIGVSDVTSSQYAAFLNAVAASDPEGLYNSQMYANAEGGPGITQSGQSGHFTYSVYLNGSYDRNNNPVTAVSFWDACRFANWLDNGQPNGPEGPGTTDAGAYTLTASAMANNSVVRNPGALWAVTSRDEWYKAAYYSPLLNNGAGGYWQYSTQSNQIPSSQQVNFNHANGDSNAAGAFPDASFYGAYDLTGDVKQWNDDIWTNGTQTGRFLDGGVFWGDYVQIRAGSGSGPDPTFVSLYDGFRVTEVPEPGLMTFAVSALALVWRRQPSSRRQSQPVAR